MRVIAAWARAVSERARATFYATEWKNLASRRVAAKLGLSIYAAGWSLTPVDPASPS